MQARTRSITLQSSWPNTGDRARRRCRSNPILRLLLFCGRFVVWCWPWCAFGEGWAGCFVFVVGVAEHAEVAQGCLLGVAEGFVVVGA